MISGGLDIWLDKTQCGYTEANAIIETFTSRADRANQRSKSDEEAEANIAMYYQDAVQEMSKLTGNKDVLGECRAILDSQAAVADIYRNGILECIGNPKLVGIYVPPTERDMGTYSAAATLNLVYGALEVVPIILGVKGYIDRLQHD